MTRNEKLEANGESLCEDIVDLSELPEPEKPYSLRWWDDDPAIAVVPDSVGEITAAEARAKYPFVEMAFLD